MNDVQPMIFAMIAETAGVDIRQIQSASNIRELGVASLDAIEMLFKIEERFDIELNDHDVDIKSATAATLVEAVNRALSKGAGKSLATAG